MSFFYALPLEVDADMMLVVYQPLNVRPEIISDDPIDVVFSLIWGDRALFVFFSKMKVVNEMGWSQI